MIDEIIVETEGLPIDGRYPTPVPVSVTVPDLKEVVEGFRVLYQIVKFFENAGEDGEVVKALLFTSFIAPVGFARKMNGIEVKHKILYGEPHVGKSFLGKVITGMWAGKDYTLLYHTGAGITLPRLREIIDGTGYPVVIDEAYYIFESKSRRERREVAEILDFLKAATTLLTTEPIWRPQIQGFTVYFFAANLYFIMNVIPEVVKGYEAFFKERCILFRFTEKLKKKKTIGNKFWQYINKKILDNTIYHVGSMINAVLHKHRRDKKVIKKLREICYYDKDAFDEIKAGQKFVQHIIKLYLKDIKFDIEFIDGKSVEATADVLYEVLLEDEEAIKEIKRQASKLWRDNVVIRDIRFKGFKNGDKSAGVALLALYTKWIWEECKYDPEKVKEEEEVDYVEEFIRWFNEYINRKLVKCGMREAVTTPIYEKIKVLEQTGEVTEFGVSRDMEYIKITKKIIDEFQKDRGFEVPWTLERWAEELNGTVKHVKIGKKIKRGIEIPVEVFRGKEYEEV